MRSDIELDGLKRTFPTSIFRRINPKQRGSTWKARCPFHPEKTPSWILRRAPGGAYLWHCFGCKRGGSVIDFVMESEGCEMQEAIQIVRSEMGVPTQNLPSARVPDNPDKLTFSEEKLRICEAALDRFDQRDSELKRFLDARGISIETAKKLQYGFRAEPKPAIVLPRFWEGELVGVKYRALNGQDPKWIQEPGSKSDFLYCADMEPVDPESDVVAVFEGELDTALVRSLGFNAVGIFGTSGVPSNPSPRFLESIENLKRDYDHLVLIGDADEVGEDAMHNLHDYIGRGCVFSRVPKPHKDITEFYQSQGESELRKWLKCLYATATECAPVRVTPAGRLKDSLTKALIQVDDGVEPPAVISALRNELQSFETSLGFPDPLGEAAFHGIFGEIVREGLPYTEADESCLLYQSLTALGNLLGRKQYASFGTDKHYPNLFTLIIGRTNAGKGQGLSQVRHLISQIDTDWTDHGCKYSTASGEGLVRLVAEREQVNDGRLCLIMPEMSVLLNSMNREGSNTSGYLRLGYDGLPLENNRSKQSYCAKNYLLSVLGHITPEEMAETMQSVDWANGIANRFLWAAVRPSKTLPRNTTAPGFDHAREIIAKILSLPDAGRLDFSAAGGLCWDEWVHALPELEGKLALSQSRIRPNALRVAEIYAAFDERRLERVGFGLGKSGEFKTHSLVNTVPKIEIEPEHVIAAIEVVTRSRQTVEWYLQTTADGGGPAIRM